MASSSAGEGAALTTDETTSKSSVDDMETQIDVTTALELSEENDTQGGTQEEIAGRASITDDGINALSMTTGGFTMATATTTTQDTTTDVVGAATTETTQATTMAAEVTTEETATTQVTTKINDEEMLSLLNKRWNSR
ncbi:Oidioi.mRNA.OKI2018_I69.chr1.g704.t1.cds [Oikopleura dioica]|uniref:Oidioi.mRNA.OKI2018_I69.chr1.g704.t1.cds n=1 Tax=Oikopleura dioica TaxID=34765 RepID=A0ABN7SSV0_OIKDI|nr:Oidioi.mRNA.OKI2018_I69.chr1.g704.t1.cds [Oikopleura dioica]